MRRLIFAESGVVKPITQLCLLNSIANRHRTVSAWAEAGRLFTVRTVIRRSYALVVGFTPKRYYPACRACIGSLPVGHGGFPLDTTKLSGSCHYKVQKLRINLVAG